MTKLNSFLIVSGLLILSANSTFGQGCSDAGVCTIDSFKPHGTDNNEEVYNQVKIGAFIGSADYSIGVYGSYLEYNRRFNDRWSADAKITSLAQSGNDISVFALSDVFLNANYKASEQLTFTVGAKIPLSDGNRSLNDLPLPMDYQASLGTYDLILLSLIHISEPTRPY